jgi:hypothetical protein
MKYQVLKMKFINFEIAISDFQNQIKPLRLQFAILKKCSEGNTASLRSQFVILEKSFKQ